MTENQKKAADAASEKKKKKSLFHKTVNVFLYIFLGLFILLLIALGITQTSTFREFARKTVLEEVNGTLNGTLNIEKLEGTIFTSLLLRNTSLVLDQDTLLRASLIEVRTSPLQLFLKRIYVRKLLIRDADISLITLPNGELNLERLVDPSPVDTTTSEFPFKIIVSDLSLNNVSFSLQNNDLRSSTALYDTLYMGDFRIEDLNMSLSATADISNNDYEVTFKGFSFNPNMNSFRLKELSGRLAINQERILADDLRIKTALSDILINSTLSDFNAFDSTSDISHALLHIDLEADKFHFADLRTFVPSMDLINDEVYFALNTEGSLKQLELNNLSLEYLSTRLGFAGEIRDLDDPENMVIIVEAEDSRIRIEDLNKLMPSLDLPPDYNRMGTVIFDTLHYTGTISKFNAHLFARTDAGNLYATSDLDLSGKDMVYDLFFRTANLNIAPFAGVESNLNSTGSVKGSGTDIQNLNAVINLNAGSSTIAGNRISELQFKSDAKNSVINYEITGRNDSTDLQLQGFLDFKDQDNPEYEFKGTATNLNIADYTGDTTLVTNLNFNVEAAGESFDLENINLFLSLNVYDSQLNGNRIDSTRAIVDLRKEDGGERVINIISDLADISITGNYSLDKSIDLISHEVKLLSAIINEKLNDIIPFQDSLVTLTYDLAREDALDFETEPGEEGTRIKYLIDLKDFELATLFLGNSQLEINGEMFGDLYNNGDSIVITFGIALDYVKYRTPESAMFLSNLKLDLDLRNNLKAESFSDVASSLSLTVHRIFAGQDIRDLRLNLSLKDNSSSIDFYANYDGNTTARLVGGFGFSDNSINLLLDTLNLNYKSLALRNREQVRINYSDERIEFQNFNLARNGGNIGIKGHLTKVGSQDLVLSIDSLNLADIFAGAFDVRPENNVYAMLNMQTRITGNMDEPVIKTEAAIDSVTYRGRNFGSLLANLDYADKNTGVNIRFVESQNSREALVIKGEIPLDLSMSGSVESETVQGPMEITLNADNFDLGAFGDLLPQVNRLAGFFTAQLSVKGTTENIEPSGFLALRDVSFISEMNNLYYETALRVNIEGENIIIDSILIRNGRDISDGGSITGSGRALLDGLGLKSADVSVGGRLKVLGPNSRYAASPVYGDLVIATRGNIEFRTDEDGMYLNAPLSIRSADLTLPPTQGSYQNNNQSFVYKFVQDTVDTAVGRMDFESLVAYNQRPENGTTAVKKTEFNYNIDLQIEDEAKIVIVLSPEINQNLTAVLRGNVLYESKGGRTDIQGELKLLEGSTLEFIKTFKADGTVRFESDITNPYLDITATYVDYYYPADSIEGLNEVLVGVKIKIKGALADLDKNFVQEEDNIGVYYGEKNIEEDERDPTKDASDAVMFIITGRFTEDLNQREQTAAAGQFTGAATSIAGSLLGGVLNQYFGEYVSGVELRKVGSETKFVFSGRAGAFRYQVGGSQDVFQNISQANVRIEYPVYKGLSLRFERREDVSDRSLVNEMVNELGLRYRFEF